MKKVVYVLVITLIAIIGCSVNNSKSNQNIIKGTVSNASGIPVQNIKIHAIHITDSPTRSVDSGNLPAYPNPITNSTTILFKISEPEQQYVLKAVNLKSMEEIEIFDDIKKEGTYSVALNLKELNLSYGIYRLYDNLDNEVDIFFAPTLDTRISFSNMSQPKTAGTASGYLIGQTVTTTDNEGKFSFSKDELLFLDKPHTIIRTNETGLELGMFSLSSKVNVVAYFDENRYAFNEIDLKQNKSHELELIITD